MERRTYLKTVGASVVTLSVSLAGCGEPGAGAETTEAPEGTPGADEGDVESPAPEETEAAATEAGGVGTTEADGAAGTTAGGAEETTAAGEAAGTATGTAEDVPNRIRMVTEGSDYYFDPVGLYVEPGEEITWVNDSGSHSSTAYAETLDAANTTLIPPEAEAWNSGIITEQGAEFTHTFEVTGTYDYFCIPHKSLGMVGRLVVGEPGGPAGEGANPDGELPSAERIVEEGAVGWSGFAEG